MEIESKVRVKDLEEIKNKLIELGASFGGLKNQEDRYFYKKEQVNKVEGPGAFVLRIRKSDKSYLTYKALTNQLGAWEEYEVLINNPEIMRKMLLKSEFVEVLHFVKSRIKGRIGEFEICLDDVRGFGKYLEVALEDVDKEIARKKIVELLNKLGFGEKDIEHRGYGELMLSEKGYKFEGMQ